MKACGNGCLGPFGLESELEECPVCGEALIDEEDLDLDDLVEGERR